MKFVWKKISLGNVILQRRGFYISYNGNPVINLEGRGETALVFPKSKKKQKESFGSEEYAILNGDHRKEYEDIISKGGGKKECLAYYEKSDDKGFWSTV